MTSRLLLAFSAFGLAVLLVLVVPLAISDQRASRDDLVRRIERDAVAVGAVATPLLAAEARSDAGSRTRELAVVTDYLGRYTDRTEVRVVVVRSDGVAVLDTDPDADGDPGGAAAGTIEGAGSPGAGRDFSTREEVATALAGEVAAGERRSQTLGYSLLYVAVPVATGGTPLGAVRITYPAAELDERVRTVRYELATLALVVLALGMLVALLLARWVVRPLQRLEEAAALMGEGDLGVRADEQSGPQELRSLARSFNGSVATLERLVLGQQEFVADASHQLRTPLQALRLRLENAAWQLGQGAPMEAGEALAGSPAAPGRRDPVDLAPMIVEVDRLAALVASLLTLARADRDLTQGDELPSAEVEVVAAVDAQLEGWRLLAARRDVVVVVEVPDGLLVRAAPLHVDQVLSNLVDNAVNASVAHDVVRIAARAVGDEVEVRIEDAGPGMDEAQVAAAFQRFGRGAPSPAGSGTGGFGLGLSIVQRLLDVDGGSIRLERRPGGGLAAVVRWSAAPGSGAGPASVA